MATKSRKSLSNWSTCEKCQALVTQRDVSVHALECPPSTDNWNHGYILDNIIYSTIETYTSQEPLKNVSRDALNDLVFIAPSTLEICNIPIGDSVALFVNDTVVVKMVWPSNDKTLTSVSMTKSAIELNKLEGLVKVKKITSTLSIAREIILENTGKYPTPDAKAEFTVLMKNYNEGKIFCIGNKISIPYYGRKLIYRIVNIKPEKSSASDVQENLYKDLPNDLSDLSLTKDNVQFYKALYSTQWTIIDNCKKEVPKKSMYTIEDIGGYSELIEDIKDVINVVLGKCKTIKGFNISKGILLYGSVGVGKSMLAEGLISEYNINTFPMRGSEIYSKYVGESENNLRDLFNKAKLNTPSLILIEDIDIFCPRKSNSSTDQERKILSTLTELLDDLQSSNERVLILATTSKIDSVDTSLRRPGRIDMEFEMSVPNPMMRRDILTKFLVKVSHNLTEEEIKEIAFITHGFVGADLYGLCSWATIHASKRQHKTTCGLIREESEMTLSMEDFKYALTVVKPSAMKEVLVEVPNVRWSDIGGQNDLKLKLKQAVEWPLKHPEAFTRLGITPPRGILMFGPPGCSKTMIAKALATESKLNFLNIKGPELFSKWVGESEKAVREIFRKARQVAPSIIFIDEIDAIGGERQSSSANSGSNVQERVLAQLLTELDGVTALGNVTLVAATNRPDRIDKALLRPGRLDRIVYVPLPDSETRLEIFNIKLKRMPVTEDVNVQDLVELTEGYSGAEVQAICHEAAMKALEENLEATIVGKEHFKAALSIVTPRTSGSLIRMYKNYTNMII
ncbi:spermatogenesis-associated protein 5 [Orussus abietinus]|uniref:spermatogenesis-associated protein 5 n=1 Tax=Orussus abietinus TaxID=222816 RepID=UPI000626E830|nr:spermatogenesis-associated protein 5 [Orussus abietinus]XP_012283786.1 spermatogenesis-associated protein 5 [Orussus abietinus]XP_012283787.1 spermatogenesis-associated protein 5 [Orussus abietinus]